MARRENNPVVDALNEFAREAGMEKHSGDWYRRTDEVTAVVDLQKSRYRPSYYVNVAFWLNQFGQTRYPKEQECHVRTRLDGLLPSDEIGPAEELLDLASEMPYDARHRKLRELLRRRLLPAIAGGMTVQGLRRQIASDDGPHYLVVRSAHAILGVVPAGSWRVGYELAAYEKDPGVAEVGRWELDGLTLGELQDILEATEMMQYGVVPVRPEHVPGLQAHVPEAIDLGSYQYFVEPYRIDED